MSGIQHKGLDLMYGTLPTYKAAPLEYRHALDAAATVLAAGGVGVVRCDDAGLESEVHQRFRLTYGAPSVVWVEPAAAGWRLTLRELAGAVATDGRLAVVASRPLALALPARSSQSRAGLGLRPGGLWALKAALRAEGLRVRSALGAHGPRSVLLNTLSRLAQRAGRPALGDRLLASARLAYVERGPLVALSTVAIIVAAKEPGR